MIQDGMCMYKYVCINLYIIKYVYSQYTWLLTGQKNTTFYAAIP